MPLVLELPRPFKARLPTSGEFDIARRLSGSWVKIGGKFGDGWLKVGLAVGEWNWNRGECVRPAIAMFEDGW